MSGQTLSTDLVASPTSSSSDLSSPLSLHGMRQGRSDSASSCTASASTTGSNSNSSTPYCSSSRSLLRSPSLRRAREQQRATPVRSDDPGLRVLVVDDNVIQLAVTIRLLKLNFSHLLCQAGPSYADSGADALAQVAAQTFDLILMDIHMPSPAGPDGLTCTHHIRSGLLPGPASRENRLTQIVALTTECGQETHATYRAAQLDGLLPKPVHLTHLQTLLQALQKLRNSSTPCARPLPSEPEHDHKCDPQPVFFTQEELRSPGGSKLPVESFAPGHVPLLSTPVAKSPPPTPSTPPGRRGRTQPDSPVLWGNAGCCA